MQEEVEIYQFCAVRSHHSAAYIMTWLCVWILVGNDIKFSIVAGLIKLLVDGLEQDCSNSIAKALELLQSCTKPSIYPVSSNFTCNEV